jgi:hypothetical protein
MSMKAHNIMQTKPELTQLHYRHKISSILSGYMDRKINESLLDKEGIHNFLFRLIEITGGEQTR